jgi:Gelsolin repeat
VRVDTSGKLEVVAKSYSNAIIFLQVHVVLTSLLPFSETYVQIDEVHNFSQDELLTEDMMILDTHAEVFLWIGQSVDLKEKQKAFEIGQVCIYSD